MRLLFAGVFLCACAVLQSDSEPAFTRRDKAFFADPNLVNFVRAGLMVKILSANIAADGTITARIRVTDPKTLPLDIAGITTPGTVSISFIPAYIPKGQTQYVAYSTRTETDAVSGRRAVQATADSGGRFQQVADGEYLYTFGAKAPAGFDASATHTIGLYASRDLTEFGLGTNYSNDVFHFVPNGSAAPQARDVINTSSCNKCHDPLAAHGGPRQIVPLCVLCHTPQTSDAQSGNTVDFKVMIHKIHRGADLPSVKAGVPYQIIGFGQSVNDYSTVIFPAEDTRNCQFCHESGPAQADAWQTHPSSTACGSCHDNVNFQTGENHVDLPVQDSQCAICHVPDSGDEFDASIKGAHTIPRFSRQLPGVVFTLQKVENGTAGQKPTITFTLRDKSGAAIDAAGMNLLNLVMAGPTSDYASVVSEDVRKAGGSANGAYVWTMQNAVPANARGTWTVGIEGYRNININPGTVIQMTVRDAGANQVLDFSLDGTAVQPRRIPVTNAQCNQCHFAVNAHATIRNQVQYCVLCHNPNATDSSQRPTSQNPAQTIAFRTMVHRIHRGENLENDYTIFGFGGTPLTFNDIRFPGDLRDCAKCHVNNSQQIPLPPGTLPVVNPRGFLNPMGPATAACLGCHDAQDAAAHASLNISPSLGEACGVCHGVDGDFSVDKVHAR